MWTAWATCRTSTRERVLERARRVVRSARRCPRIVAAVPSRGSASSSREGYGLTEASPVVTASATGRRHGSGRSASRSRASTVRLVDADGEDALVGDAGEIWVQGPNVFAGYWHDDEATAHALTPDGWLRTGDVAVADDDGYLYLVDRAKDLIIVSGFNVYPAEVEEVLREHPGVEEVAVVGVARIRTRARR